MPDERQGQEGYPARQEPAQALAERAASSVAPHVPRQEAEFAEAEDDAINLRDYWQVVVKRKWTVITFFLIVVTSVVTATFLMTPIYRATLTMQIEKEAAKIVDYNKGVMPVEAAGDRDFYQTQYELLKSRTLAERVVDQLGLAHSSVFLGAKESGLWQTILAKVGNADDKGAARAAAAPAAPTGQKAALAGQFLSGLTIEPVRNSRLVKIHYDSPDPQLAARIVNTLALVYINVNLERRFDASSYAKTFLEERLQQIKAKLEDSERQLVDYSRQQEIINIDDKQTTVSRNLDEFNGALAKAQQDRIKAEALYQQVETSDMQNSSLVLANPVIQKLKESLVKFDVDYQDNLRIYKPAYPKMQQLEAQIAETKAKIVEEMENWRSAIKADYEGAKVREALLKSKFEENKNEVLSLQTRSIQYNILKREADTNRQLYEGLLQRLKEVGVAGGVGTNNISIVDKADVPTGKFKPSLRTNGLIAVFLGLFGGIGLAFFFEYLDDTVKQPEDLERLLGIPALGMIPIVKEARSRGRDDPGLAITGHEDQRSAFAEAYRSVRTALQFSTPEGAPKVLMVTSTSMGEGKSTTALSLAMHFAEAGKNVLLVDTDLRNPSLHRTLKIDNGQGLTNYLAGDAKPVDITQPTQFPNLFMIPTGPLPPNPAELLSSAKMVSLLSLAAEKFQHVILDGPPVLGLADALVLGNLADGTILVVAAGTTRRGYAQGAIKRLKTARARLLGGILTKLDARGNAYGYYQSYYYYYGDSASASKRLSA